MTWADRIGIDAVRSALARAADPERAPQMQAYMKSQLPYHGVAMPDVRRIARQVFRDRPPQSRAAWEATVRALFDAATRRLTDRTRVEPVVRGWIRSDDLWLRRVAIICQLGHRDATDLDLLVDAITPALPERAFFLRKAIGWSLREYAKTDPDWVRRFVTEHAENLSGLSKREVMKHLSS